MVLDLPTSRPAQREREATVAPTVIATVVRAALRRLIAEHRGTRVVPRGSPGHSADDERLTDGEFPAVGVVR